MGASLKLILYFFAVAKNNRNHRKSAFYLAKSYMYGFSLKIRLKIAYTSFQVFGRTYPPRKAHYSDKNEASPDFLPLWEAPPKASKIQPEF